MATWPATLPPPEKTGYQLAPTDPTIRTEMEVGLPRTRRRTAARDDRITVTWKFTDAQMQTFRTFFNGDGQGGAAWFTIDLASGNTGIDSESARFASMWQAELLPGLNWRVTATLEVR